MSDCSKVLVNYTIKTVFDPLLARVCGDGQSSDEDAGHHVQVCCLLIICVAVEIFSLTHLMPAD